MVVKLKLNNEIDNKASAADPEAPSPQVPKNTEKVKVPRTISLAAAQPPPNDRRASTGKVSVRTTYI